MTNNNNHPNRSRAARIRREAEAWIARRWKAPPDGSAHLMSTDQLRVVLIDAWTSGHFHGAIDRERREAAWPT